MTSETNSNTHGSPHSLQDRISEALIRDPVLRRRNVELAAELAATKASASFRIGAALVSAVRSGRELLRLPAKLFKIIFERASGAVPDVDGLDNPELRLPCDEAAALWSRRRTGRPARLRDLRIATVLDEFSHQCLEPECLLIPMPLSGFEELLDESKPHFLLIESAWNGNSGAWRNGLASDSLPLLFLLDCCRRREIPTIFWNKEDPVHFEHFIGIARLFDHVFTTDRNVLQKYAERGCRKPAELLQFFCQPAIHNPIQTGEARRKEAACFCGSWYAQYPQRSADLSQAIDVLASRMPVDIYDRNYHRSDPAFDFPERYAKMVKPSVSFEKLPELYRSYRFGININTVTLSPSMYSRRIHELAACGTAVVTNYSVAAFSDYGNTITYLDRDNTEAQVDSMRSGNDAKISYVRDALDIVMTQHTAAVRLAHIVKSVLDIGLECRPLLRVIAVWPEKGDLVSLIEAFDRISWVPKKLAIVFSGEREEVRTHDCERLDVEVLASTVPVCTVARSPSGERWYVMRHEQSLPVAYLESAMAAAVYVREGALGVPIDEAGVDQSNVALRPETCLLHPAQIQPETMGAFLSEGARDGSIVGVGISGIRYET